MKSVVIAASALAAVALAAPAFAQDSFTLDPVTGYVNLGYLNSDLNGVGLNALGGRAGAQFGKYLGAEGELQFGVGTTGTDTPNVDEKLHNAYAAYLVGHLPLTANGEVFVRGGYGHSDVLVNDSGSSTDVGRSSWNFGGGAQYFFAPHDGMRLDYTREEFRDDTGNANVWSLSWVHRF
jgi:hypothetical protein